MIFLAADINVPIWAFLSLVISAIGVPLMTSWIRSREKKMDWKRQDEVAKRVQEASVKVAGAADLLVKSNAEVATAANANSEKIAEIHHMVDGQMTIAMQESLDSKVTSMVLMREVIELKRARKVEPSVRTLATMETLERQVTELTDAIAKRQALVKAAENKRDVSFMTSPTEGTR